MGKKVLLIIDPQEDFCSEDKGVGGALPVPGPGNPAGRNALRNVAKMIHRCGGWIDDIIRTFDQHHRRHIAHPHEYLLPNGKNPPPFNCLREEKGEILIGTLDANGFHPWDKVRRRLISDQKWTLQYLRRLQDGGRYPHCLWNPHCIIGTPGACAIPEIVEAVGAWEDKYCALSPAISKGSNIRTEHFGALRAEVPDPNDETTQVNTAFLRLLQDPEITDLFICGLAKGFCLANTFRDTAAEFDGDTLYQKAVLLQDGTADVAGFEFLGDAFEKESVARGMRVALTTDL